MNKIFEVLTSRQSKTCSDIMTIEPLTIDDRDPAAQAVRLMQKNNFSQIPVLRGTKMVGIITERDIIRNLRHDMSELSVQAVMSPEGVPIIDETTAVDTIAPLFQKYQAILVHKQGRIRGIITRSDFLKLA